jgi:hypothetical protein
MYSAISSNRYPHTAGSRSPSGGPQLGIPFYWRVELTATRIPVVYTYLLDSASRRYRDGDVFTGIVKASVPFPVEVDLSTLG